MKNFDDFLKTLTQDEIEKMIADINPEGGIKSHLPTTQAGANDFMNASATYSLLISISLLNKYHNWLHDVE